MIQNGDRTKFDVEVLKQLLKLLPEKHEVCAVNTPASFFIDTCLLFKNYIACLSHWVVSILDWKSEFIPRRKREIGKCRPLLHLSSHCAMVTFFLNSALIFNYLHAACLMFSVPFMFNVYHNCLCFLTCLQLSVKDWVHVVVWGDCISVGHAQT